MTICVLTWSWLIQPTRSFLVAPERMVMYTDMKNRKAVGVAVAALTLPLMVVAAASEADNQKQRKVSRAAMVKIYSDVALTALDIAQEVDEDLSYAMCQLADV